MSVDPPDTTSGPVTDGDGTPPTTIQGPDGRTAGLDGADGAASPAAAGAVAVPAPGRSWSDRLRAIDYVALWPIAVMILIILITDLHTHGAYLKLTNLWNVLSQISPLGIITMGQAILLISAGLDLSVGYNASFAAIVTGLLLEHGHPLGLDIVAGIAAATAVGFVNGVLAAQNRAHPFIITLGMSIFLFGLDTQLTGSAPINDMGRLYTWFGGNLGGTGIPTVAIPLVVVVILTYMFLRWTRLGRQAYAIGGNEEATYLAGIRVKRTKILLYSVMGLIVGVAGLILAGEINEASFNLAQNYELESIACAVIGGVALFGGRGGAFRALMGVALYGVVQNAISFVGLSSNYQQMALGVIIIVAVMVTRSSTDRGTRRWRTALAELHLKSTLTRRWGRRAAPK
jgi:ribose/xylose/arabinose/galactoside ABC-type transport system permease subunit